jgi:hypothetical protein
MKAMTILGLQDFFLVNPGISSYPDERNKYSYNVSK